MSPLKRVLVYLTLKRHNYYLCKIHANSYGMRHRIVSNFEVKQKASLANSVHS